MIGRDPAVRITAVLFALLWAPVLVADSIVPRSWEELALDADFIGIVECETAGGIVARYRVIETWTGSPAAGDRMSIAQGVGRFEPVFPIALCGERSLVLASRQRRFFHIPRLNHTHIPLWWRRLPVDYGVSSAQGSVRLPLGDGDSPFFRFGSTCRTPEEFKGDIDRLFSLPAAEREMSLLKKWVAKARSDSSPEESLPDGIRGTIEKAAAPVDIVNRLLEFGREHPAVWGRPIMLILRCAGGEKTLEIVEALPVERIPGVGAYRKLYREDVSFYIRRRLRLTPPPSRVSQEWTPDASVPSEEELNKARASLSTGQSGVNEAFDLLARHDPDRVTAFLVAWERREGERSVLMHPYVLGSYFAYQCGRDRDRHLRALLQAKDPYVRVAGAVYLCFENQADGTDALRELMAIEGDPGAWAAVVLASRGDKTSVPRALRVLAVDGGGYGAGSDHRNLQNRLKVLLSNTARASGLSQPAPPPPPQPERVEGTIHFADPSPEEIADYHRRLHRYYADWWAEHRERAVLIDPWLPLLEKQKVD